MITIQNAEQHKNDLERLKDFELSKMDSKN